ncbi:hypothetical protein [Rhizobium sp. Rhizsp42]|uniref:hypothetical protein n=1 Tax=Rhizobium sp. Rhizsp42 TaxID=3243034 RepID=UPI0039B0A1DF
MLVVFHCSNPLFVFFMDFDAAARWSSAVFRSAIFLNSTSNHRSRSAMVIVVDRRRGIRTVFRLCMAKSLLLAPGAFPQRVVVEFSMSDCASCFRGAEASENDDALGYAVLPIFGRRAALDQRWAVGR